MVTGCLFRRTKQVQRMIRFNIDNALVVFSVFTIVKRLKSARSIFCTIRAAYFELTDWTGRAVHTKKTGSIPEGLPSLLTRLGLSKENWIDTVTGYEKYFSDFVGHEASMKDASATRGTKWLRGLCACQHVFSTSSGEVKATGASVVGLFDAGVSDMSR